MTSSTGIEETDESAEQQPPIYDPRRSGLRLDDSEEQPREEDEAEEPDTSVAEDDDRTLSDAEIEVTAPAATDSELEEPNSCINTAFTQDGVLDSARKFEESMRRLKKKDQDKAEESYVVLPNHFSEGNDVDEITRSVLDEMDPYDPATTRTDALAQRVKELIERTSAEAQKPAVEAVHTAEEETTEAPHTNEMIVETSRIPDPPLRAISLTPQIKTGPPIAKSTPLNPNTKPAPRFPNLNHIPEEAEGSQSINLNFTEPPSDVLALLMSQFGQHKPFNQDMNPQTHKESLSSSPEVNSDGGKDVRVIPLPLKNNIITSRQCLTYKRDNYVHFLSRDCEPHSFVARLLSEIGAVDLKGLHAKKLKIGQILITPYKYHNIFSLIVKKKYYDPTKSHGSKEV